MSCECEQPLPCQTCGHCAECDDIVESDHEYEPDPEALRLEREIEKHTPPGEPLIFVGALVDITSPGDGPWRVVSTEDGDHALKYDVMTGERVSACGGVGYVDHDQAIACCAALNALEQRRKICQDKH